jgi:NAD(P)-dependent dehydrogenase (short-subunit alcohol dehydrogenase family)
MGGLRLSDRVAIVTGSSSGLGRAIAFALATNGARVVCSDLDPVGRQAAVGERTTHETITNSGGKAVFIKADASDSESVQALVKGAVDAFGRIDMYGRGAIQSNLLGELCCDNQGF